MALVIDATPGSATANSYNTEAAVAAVAEETYPSTWWWGERAGDDRRRIMVGATRWLDLLQCVGSKSSTTQALEWPRRGESTIPGAVSTAHALLCFYLADG